jgi:hypothetical protein
VALTRKALDQNYSVAKNDNCTSETEKILRCTPQSSFLDYLVTTAVAQAHKREVGTVNKSVKEFSVLDC